MSVEEASKRRSLSWWFTRGPVSLITIPVFLVLLLGVVLAFVQGGVQTFAYMKVLKAIFGWLGLVAFLFVWPFSLFVPAALWWAAITEIPKIISQQATKKGAMLAFIFGILFLPGCSEVIQWTHGKVIGWIADRNPDAAYRVGVTGSHPPSFQEHESAAP